MKNEKYLVELNDKVNDKYRSSHVWYYGEAGIVYTVTKVDSNKFEVIGLKGPYGPHKDSGPLYITSDVCTVLKKLKEEEEMNYKFNVGDFAEVTGGNGYYERQSSDLGSHKFEIGEVVEIFEISDPNKEGENVYHCRNEYNEWYVEERFLQGVKEKKEEETMKRKFKVVEPFTPYDVIQKHKEVFGWKKLQDSCSEFLEDLDLLIEVAEGDVYGTIESEEDLDLLELEERDEMRNHFLKWELIEEVEEVEHDWAGLKIKVLPGTANILTLYDSNSDKYLLGFHQNGKVLKFSSAEGGAGFFDERGRLVID